MNPRLAFPLKPAPPKRTPSTETPPSCPEAPEPSTRGSGREPGTRPARSESLAWGLPLRLRYLLAVAIEAIATETGKDRNSVSFGNPPKFNRLFKSQGNFTTINLRTSARGTWREAGSLSNHRVGPSHAGMRLKLVFLIRATNRMISFASRQAPKKPGGQMPPESPKPPGTTISLPGRQHARTAPRVEEACQLDPDLKNAELVRLSNRMDETSSWRGIFFGLLLNEHFLTRKEPRKNTYL